MDLYQFVREKKRLDLLLEWDRAANPGLDPAGLTPASREKVVWVCPQGHRWTASVAERAKGQGTCPVCAAQKAASREKTLADDPRLAAEWDAEKNNRSPAEVTRGSALPAWWRCEKGHSYQAAVYARAAGTECPYCTGKKVLAGFNDLATTDPALCREWDAERNFLKPDEVNRGSHKTVWWRCEKGHRYEAAVYARAAGNGCPYCAGKKVLAGFNDLATTHPALAKEWDTERNGSLTPEQVSKGSNKKVWWRCGEGHVWQATVFSRTRKRASACPVCAGRSPAAAPPAEAKTAAHRREVSPDASAVAVYGT